MKFSWLAWLVIFSFVSGCNNNRTDSEDTAGTPVCNRLEPAKTGIKFINEGADQEKFNILTD